MVPPMLDHEFNGTPFTVGIEEELMICDGESLELAQGIEQVLGALPGELPGKVKPELMQSVLEIATVPCGSVGEAGRQLGRATPDRARGRRARSAWRSAQRGPIRPRCTRSS